MNHPERPSASCTSKVKAVRDSLDVLGGKWKIHILGTLMHGGTMRFGELQREIGGIGPKMLAKELRDLEMNHLLTRISTGDALNAVEYELTDLGKALEPVVQGIVQWGAKYRAALLGM